MVLVGIVFGLVWLYFWLRGYWFAAVVGMAPAVALAVVADYWTAWPLLFAVVAWLPFGLRMLWRYRHEFLPQDEPFTPSKSLSLRLRD